MWKKRNQGKELWDPPGVRPPRKQFRRNRAISLGSSLFYFIKVRNNKKFTQNRVIHLGSSLFDFINVRNGLASYLLL
jgi:hypothetical protein